MRKTRWLWSLLVVVMAGCRFSALPTVSAVATPTTVSPIPTPTRTSPLATPTIEVTTVEPTSVPMLDDNVLFLPLVADAKATPTPTPQPTPAPQPTRTELPPPVSQPWFGIQIDPNTDDLVARAALGSGDGIWVVKVQVEWAIIEQPTGVFAGRSWIAWLT